jgi:hypothetical protein
MAGVTTYILWIFLANGNIYTRATPNLGSCLATQASIQADHEIRHDTSITKILCLAEDERTYFLPPDKQ